MFLYQKETVKDLRTVVPLCTIVWNRATGKAASPQWLVKNTCLVDGVLMIKDNVRGSKNFTMLRFHRENLTLAINDGPPRQLKYALMTLGDVDLVPLTLQEVHDMFSKGHPGGDQQAGQELTMCLVFFSCMPDNWRKLNTDIYRDAIVRPFPFLFLLYIYIYIYVYTCKKTSWQEADNAENPGRDHDEGADDQDEPQEIEEPEEIDEFQNMLVARLGDAAIPPEPHAGEEEEESPVNIHVTDDECENPRMLDGDCDIRIESADLIADAGSADQLRVTRAGQFGTPAYMKLLCPPVAGCRLQRRTPDGVVQVWFPGHASRTFRFALKDEFTNATVPRRLVTAALRQASTWAWELYEGLVGEAEAERAFQVHQRKVEELGIDDLFLR